LFTHHHANGLICPGLGEGKDAFLVHLRIEGILSGWPVEADDKDALTNLGRDRGEWCDGT